ncbi:MAG: hypothetical protein M3P26_15390 [Gemmatimonadota bacterium]|nr:hypothetical protein [Gemmatimonadota bacterium]
MYLLKQEPTEIEGKWSVEFENDGVALRRYLTYKQAIESQQLMDADHPSEFTDHEMKVLTLPPDWRPSRRQSRREGKSHIKLA